MMQVDTAVVEKLRKLMPRLASDHDGEVVATAHAIRRVLAGVGLSLNDMPGLINVPPTKEADAHANGSASDSAKAQPTRERFSIADRAAFLHLVARILNERSELNTSETGFLRQMLSSCKRYKGFEMSLKQVEWLLSIADRFALEFEGDWSWEEGLKIARRAAG